VEEGLQPSRSVIVAQGVRSQRLKPGRGVVTAGGVVEESLIPDAGIQVGVVALQDARPIAVLWEPDMLRKRAANPTAVLKPPPVLFASALVPSDVLPCAAADRTVPVINSARTKAAARARRVFLAQHLICLDCCILFPPAGSERLIFSELGRAV
jgi:hypothetical protein